MHIVLLPPVKVFDRLKHFYTSVAMWGEGANRFLPVPALPSPQFRSRHTFSPPFPSAQFASPQFSSCGSANSYRRYPHSKALKLRPLTRGAFAISVLPLVAARP